MSRETVMQALFDLIDGAYAWTTSSRRLQPLANITAIQRPAMFISESAPEIYQWGGSTTAPVHRGGSLALPFIFMQAQIVIYTDSKDPTVIGATQINEILDAIDFVLRPEPQYRRQTLGGRCDHCRIDGHVHRVSGDLDGDGMLIVPIVISLPISG